MRQHVEKAAYRIISGWVFSSYCKLAADDVPGQTLVRSDQDGHDEEYRLQIHKGNVPRFGEMAKVRVRPDEPRPTNRMLR